MAKKRSYRKKPRRVRIASNVACTALATLDVTAGPITGAAADPYRLLSIKNTYAWGDIAAAIDDGLEFGVAHSDYTEAEIEECLESQGSMDLGDKVQQEHSNRLVRSLGRISSASAIVGGAAQPFNGGRPLKTKLNWLMSTGDTLNLWVRNGSGTVWTVGSGLFVQGDLWLVDA